MAHHNTILRQIVAFLPRHEFDALADRAFFQMDQGQGSRSKCFWEHRAMRADPSLDCPDCVPVPCLFEMQSQAGSSLEQMLHLLQLNLFERRNFIELFKPPEKQPAVSPQLLLFQKL